jgi:hypothetical protein
MEFSTNDRTSSLTMQVRRYTMQPREATTYEREHGRAPASSSKASLTQEIPLRPANETHDESEAYTAEEEALVEERLKNLGYLSALDVPVVWAVGGLFDFVSGRIPRGPRWMTQHGLEWLCRLMVEPRRLWRRYLLGNPRFLWRVLTTHGAATVRHPSPVSERAV